MNTIKVIIRVLIVFTFFAPFVTCKHPLEGIPLGSAAPADTSFQITDSMLLKEAGDTSVVKNHNDSTARRAVHSNIWVKIADKIISPVEDCTSGIGIIFSPPNNIYEISLVLSFLISLFLIFNWRFLKKKRLRWILSILNFILVSIFIIFCFCGDEFKVIWGAWLLLIFIFSDIVLQYFTEIKSKIISIE